MTRGLFIALVGLFTFTISSTSQAQKYKAMMHDWSYNFYDICEEADAYFKENGTGKGSGYKPFQRWKNENESKFYPTGDRSKSDPLMAEKALNQLRERGAGRATHSSQFDQGWRDLGPYDANNITSHYSPGIGRVESFWVNPNNDQTLMMGSRSGGFWLSKNGGQTWLNSTDTLTASGVNTIAVNPNDTDEVLINVRNGANGTSHGIYRSLDGGITWAITEFKPIVISWGGLGSNGQVYKIVYHPTIPDLVFVGTNRGIYRSTDNLQTFVRLQSAFDVIDIDFHPTDANKMYIYDYYFWGNNRNRIFTSVDTGNTFIQGPNLANNSNAKCFIAVSPVASSSVWVASNNGIWKSTDEGSTFTFISNPPESCQGFAVNDMDSTNWLYGYVDLEVTTNDGTSFTQTTTWAQGNPSNTYVHADLRTAESINGIFYVGTDGYLAKSTTNGTFWDRLNDGTGIRENYAVGVSQSNEGVMMSGSQDNGTSMYDAGTWKEWNGGDGMEAVVQPLNDRWLIGSWQYGTRNRTTDGGLTRNGVGTPQSGSSQAYWESPMFINPMKSMQIFHFSDSIFKADEFAEDWNFYSDPGLSGQIREAAMAYNDSNTMVVTWNSDIRLTKDGGQTWSNIKSTLPANTIRSLCFDPKDDETIIVTYNRYQNDLSKIYVTHDQGQTWTNITYNLGNMPVLTAIIDFTSDRNIYVGTELGVFTMPMNGSTWAEYNKNLPTVAVKELEMQWGSNELKAATWGRGLWEYTLVGRLNYPKIINTKITDTPTWDLPKETVNQYVTSIISYDQNISAAYVKWSVNGIALDSTITMVNTVDSTWKTVSSIPDFPAGTDVYFKIFIVGSNNDTTESYRYQYDVRPFEYCAAQGATGTGADWISGVELHTLNNTSTKTQYSDFSAQSVLLERGNTYTLTIKMNFSFALNSTVAWVDWNQNATFDSTEIVNMSAIDANHESTASITVPANAPMLENLRLRVRCQYGTGGPVACGNVAGEVEDYTIVVKCVPESFDETESACGSFQWRGQTFTTTGNYVDSVIQTGKCDKIYNLNLTIDSMPNNTVTSNGNGSLSAAQGAATYQWLTCDTSGNMTPISGAISVAYTAPVNGSYAVQVTNGTCQSVSSCTEVTGITPAVIGGLKSSGNTFIYPNPVRSKAQIVASTDIQYLKVFDINGKVVFSSYDVDARKASIDVTQFSSGLYEISVIYSNGAQEMLQLIVE